MKPMTPEVLDRAASVVFDLDGTLFDSALDVARSFCRAVRMHGFETPEPETVRIGPPLEVMIRAFVGEVDPGIVEAIADEFRRHYDAAEYPDTHLYPGALELLKRLHERGIRLSVATNKRSVSTGRLLRIKGIAELFDEVTSIDRDGEHWSKQRMLRHILSVTGTKASETIFFGDSVGDIAAGRDVAVTTVGVLYGYEPPSEILRAAPDYTCNNLTDLV